jgi:hypothetical protein
MAYTNDTKPLNSSQVTWATITTTWAIETRTWEFLGNSQTYTNDSK